MAYQLAGDIIAAYDSNKTKSLDPAEWRWPKSRFGNIGGADLNGNGNIERDELGSWILSRLPPVTSSRLVVELRVFDSNGDGQVTQSEFAPDRNPDRIAEFREYDDDGDGLITPSECRTRV